MRCVQYEKIKEEKYNNLIQKRREQNRQFSSKLNDK